MSNVTVAIVGAVQFNLEHHLVLAAKGNRRSQAIIGRWCFSPDGEEYHREALKVREARKVSRTKKVSASRRKSSGPAGPRGGAPGTGLSRFRKNKAA